MVIKADVEKAYAVLDLDRQIVGIKIVKSKTEFEQAQAKELTYPLAYCVAVRNATNGIALKMTKEFSGCRGSAKVLGLTPPTESFYNGQDGCDLGLYESPELAASVAKQMKFCPPDTYGVIIKPLEQFEADPDVVLMVGVNVLVDTSNPADAAKYLKTDVFSGEIIATSGKFAAENPKTVQGFVNAVHKGTKWINEHSAAEVAKLISPLFQGMNEDVIAMKIAILKGAVTKTGYISEESQTAVENFCIKNGVIKAPIPYNQIIDMQFVKAIK